MSDELTTAVLRDALALFCDTPLGEGRARSVFVLGTDATRVVKIETVAGSFQNIVEWETWRNLVESRYAAFLAPCYAISPCGTALVQARVKPLPDDSDPLMRALRLPDFLTDHKRENYGVYEGRVVACDYGSNLTINHGAFASKMRKPEWW